MASHGMGPAVWTICIFLDRLFSDRRPGFLDSANSTYAPDRLRRQPNRHNVYYYSLVLNMARGMSLPTDLGSRTTLLGQEEGEVHILSRDEMLQEPAPRRNPLQTPGAKSTLRNTTVPTK
ncbi:hypothetical protein LX32DRAFT_679837 [Colletotrichum zoysiae]|uniref:Uncharacterized protein n=1 Tax=Colletotrichum zoysiae TaxID=1216348 RepID=A0AAD9HSI2_9PEZI|nr:hypothetical protein LX32DRAFT_679837 [Colletotrichum zoysiae]